MIKECNTKNRTRRRRADKPWRKRHRGAFGKPIELCLCPVCANTYYLMDDHYIKRVDHTKDIRTLAACAESDTDMTTRSMTIAR